MPYDDIHDMDDFDATARRIAEHASLQTVRSDAGPHAHHHENPKVQRTATPRRPRRVREQSVSSDSKSLTDGGLLGGADGDIPHQQSDGAAVPVRNPSWFKTGEPGPALTHGLYSLALRAALALEREQFEAQSIEDDGGRRNLSARRQSLHRYRARLHVQIEAIAGALERVGHFDQRGRLRTQWMARMESLVTVALRVDLQLGLDRRPRDVTDSDDPSLLVDRRE